MMVAMAFKFVPLFAALGSAAQFYSQKVLPKDISSGCANALLAEVDCSPAVPALQAGTFYPKTDLDNICTSACASSLVAYHSAILAACASDNWTGFQDTVEPVAFISEMIRYHYNFTCMSDGTRLCNNVAAAYAVFLDPETAALPGGLPAGGDYGGYEISDPCDGCLVDSLRFQAGSPYYLGLELQNVSAYESRTSSCGISGAPLTTTPLSIFSPTPTVPSTPTCAGAVYDIQAGDDCNSISLSQGIGTEWLVTDNDLTAFCYDFPTSGELCLVNKCDIYTVLEGDTCKVIAKAHSISEAQLRAWNPSIDAGCYNLEAMVGDQLCVSLPGTPYVDPAPTTIAPSIPTTPAPVPTDVADGTNENCGRYYKAIVGDYCNALLMKFSINLKDFLFLNSAINENCTNLYAEESYCVQPVGDINTYPGRPGHVTFTFNMTSFDDSATLLPAVNWSSPTATTTKLPLATGTRGDCSRYIAGDDYQKVLDDTPYLVSNCHLAAEVMGVPLEDLGFWNPSLGNSTEETCAFEPGHRYCGKYFDGHIPPPEVPEEPTLPERDGMTSECTLTVNVDEYGPTCEYILEEYGLTIAQFYEWNPSVGPDCGGMWLGYQYCVQTDEPGPTVTTTATPTGPTPPAPTQTGQPSNCNKWHVAADGEDCGVLEAKYDISHADFLSWNPAVSDDCVDGFWGDYAYCVAVSGDTTPPTDTITSDTPGPTRVPAPEPNQEGNAIDSCNEYGQAQDGDWCAKFAERHGVSVEDLYAWNSALGAGGKNCDTAFWVDYWYCIGVAA